MPVSLTKERNTMERPVIRLPLPVKVCFPTGALMDIPTGDWIEGTHGQMVLNGGVASITGLVGPGNSGKTTLMRHMSLTVIARCIMTVGDIYYCSYDTEVNTHEARGERLSFSMHVFKDYYGRTGQTLIDDGVWNITDRSVYMGNEMFEEWKTYLKAKGKQRNPFKYETAFIGRDGKPMKVMVPSISEIDSLSQFYTADVDKILNTTEAGQSEANMLFARAGLAKSRILMEMPSVAAASNHYFLFTAHLGKEMVIPSGPGTPPPKKQLQHMTQGEVIKGVTNNFFYLLHNCWLVANSRPYLNSNTKAPEYPYEPGYEIEGDLDLNIMTIKQLRGKNGSSGFALQIIWSQEEGVLPGLTEFHYLKENERFGLEGNVQNYSLILYPDVSLSRTKVRKLIREDKKLQRALEITSQLCQMYEFQGQKLKSLLVKPEEIRKVLTEKGYDWNFILENTRGWNTLNDEQHPGFPLSTYDLCRIVQGTYHPYWLEADCKTVKPEYLKKKIPEIYTGPAPKKDEND